ncbi:MAG TPA: hypothetical protein PKA63_11390 [Oligoflexia bacterium]|nr:hypothetical protein [Oligoflexia bacterium]HMP49262.1 hypothetical protein [Oligoflexia bacterium]
MLLLRPLKSRFSSRFRSYKKAPSAIFRDILITTLLFVFSLLIFGIAWWTLNQLSKETTLLLPPELLLVFSFNIFIPMIFFTALSSAISQYFQSEDLELLLASPISKCKFFLQRSLVVSAESAWMSIISLLPFLLAFSVSFQASNLYYFILPLYLILFVLIPSSFAILVSVLWGLIIPRIPPLIIVSFVVISGTYLLAQLFSLIGFYLSNTDQIDTSVLLTAVSKIESFGSSWSPGTWLAKGLSPFLMSSGLEDINQTTNINTLLYSTLAGLSCLGCFGSMGYLTFSNFYPQALSNVWGKNQKVLAKKAAPTNSIIKLAEIPDPIRSYLALFKKESLDFFRDSSQIVQALFLISILGIYLYVLRFQQNLLTLFKDINPEAWDNMLIIANLTLECFILVAMATRLVFPSLSREGRGIWILQTSPVPLSRLIIVKYIFWSLPIAVIVSILSFVSFYLQYHTISVAIVKVLISLSSVSVVTALGMFLGARFSNFLWESRSQLIASFGSLVYMVSALSLMVLLMLASTPVLLMLTRNIEESIPPNFSYLLTACIFTMNILLAKVFLEMSGKNLKKKLLLDE